MMGESLDVNADIAAALARHRQRGERVVFTNGCFDLLHPGHLEGLRQARALGDCLVVGVNSDASVRRLKGGDRPIVPLDERVELLRAIRWVDHVVSFDAATPADLIACLRPDVYAKGADWRERSMPEAEAARAVGGEVVFLELMPGYSTTDIVDRIRAVPLTPAE